MAARLGAAQSSVEGGYGCSCRRDELIGECGLEFDGGEPTESTTRGNGGRTGGSVFSSWRRFALILDFSRTEADGVPTRRAHEFLCPKSSESGRLSPCPRSL